MEKIARRATAACIDYIVWTIIYGMVFFFLALLIGEKAIALISFPGLFMGMVGMQYLSDMVLRGNTAGRFLMKIKVVSDNPKRFALLHSPCKIFCALLWPAFLHTTIKNKDIVYDNYLSIRTVNKDSSYSAELVCRRLLAEYASLVMPVIPFSLLCALIVTSCTGIRFFETDYGGVCLILCFVIVFQVIFDVFMDGRSIWMKGLGLEVIRNENFSKWRFLILHGITKTLFTVAFLFTVPYMMINISAPYDKMFGITVQVIDSCKQLD